MIFNKRSTILLILIFLFLGLSAQETSLSEQYKEVERLIEILDYNQAINLLVDIVKDNPEEMEKAQNKIQEIREKKEEFNIIYEELITVLFEENDYEKGLELIDELEQLDKNPNPATEESIKDARISAELIYFRLLFNEAMDRAYKSLIDGNYDEAVSTYLTVFQFHKRTYDERDYGDIIKGPVDQNLEDLLSAASEFLAGYSRVQSPSAEQITDITAENERVLSETKALMEQYAALRNTVWHGGWTFRHQNELLGEINSDYSEDFFLSFAWRIVYGRTAVDQDEGLVVAMDTFWSGKLLAILDGLEQNLISVVGQAETAYQQKNWSPAQNLFEQGEFWASQGVEYNRLWSEIMNLDDRTNLNEKSLALLNQYYNKQTNFRTNYSHAGLLALLSQFNQRLDNYKVFNDQDFALMNSRRDILEEEIGNLNPQLETWQTLDKDINSDEIYTDTVAKELVSASLQEIQNLLDSYSELNGTLSLRMADIILVPLEEEYENLTEEENSALAYLEGISEGEEGSLLYVYPQRSLDLLKIVAEENAIMQDKVNQFLEEYRLVQADIPQKSAMEAYLGRGEDLLSGLKTAEQEYNGLVRQADQNLALSERYLNEGEYRFSQSERALNNRDFSQAVQELTSAQDLFVQALSYDEDIISREETDRRIAELQARILAEENREVIRFVRENVNEGKSLYLQGRYAQSEVVLLRAESRWFTTNTEPNSEINYWLNLVRAALSVESGRTIEDTEPLYAEMTQYLNLAYSNFEKGRILIEEGNLTDGLKLLDRADQNLNEILIPMPLNQAASVLKLRIQQLRDPDLFNVVFSERFKGALEKLKTESDVAYIELKDLSEIEPDYPGIGRAIYNAEILLGIRVPPPNPAALRESQELYNKAFVIVEGNVRSQFPVALAQLEKSIELNPDNSRAIELKDRIQLDAGGQTTIVLSSAAQSQFKNAEEKYINGEYFESYAIVQQLLKDGNNASYPPLQDLKRRLESKF